jgi:hypothetical protein
MYNKTVKLMSANSLNYLESKLHVAFKPFTLARNAKKVCVSIQRNLNFGDQLVIDIDKLSLDVLNIEQDDDLIEDCVEYLEYVLTEKERSYIQKILVRRNNYIYYETNFKNYLLEIDQFD